MPNLKIRVYKGDDQQPETTVTIPSDVIKIASHLIPKKASESLQDKGIDLDEIVKLSDNPEARGNLVEIEEHKKNERVVISLE